MRVTLVRPNIGRLEHSLFVDEARMEPLELGTLAGLTPADVDVVLADDRVGAIDYDAPTDLAAISVQTFTARRAYEIAAEYRARGVPVVMGGMHVSLAPEEAREHADAIVIGDAEPVWEAVVRDTGAGRLKPRYTSRIGVPHPGVLPRRDLYRGNGYLPLAVGLGWNALLVVFFTVVATGVPTLVSEVAISGIGEAAGPTVDLAGSLFVILAMLTSYWSVSLALSDILHERTGLAPRLAWFLSTVPTLVLIVVGVMGFLEYLRLAGGITGVIVVVVTVPMYIAARRRGPIADPPWRLGRVASVPVLVALAICVVAMAVGSFLAA